MKLSVIIPTRNRAKVLEKALKSLTKQTLEQKHFEVIVIDNGSTDDTKEVVESFLGKIKSLIYIYDDNPGLHVGRHRGLLASRCDILVYGDDDIEATPKWLEGVLDGFEDKYVVLVGGKNLPKFETKPPIWISDMWEEGGNEKVLSALSILDFGDNTKEINPFCVFGCNFSIRKNILLEAGGFHPDGMPQEIIKYRGDGESHVSKYILDQGYKTIYNPKASVYHLCSTNRMTKEYFRKRHYNHGISDSYTVIREGRKANVVKRKIKHIIKKYFLFRDVETESSYLKGFLYHQEEVKKDKYLIEWIKRDSYINNGEVK